MRLPQRPLTAVALAIIGATFFAAAATAGPGPDASDRRWHGKLDGRLREIADGSGSGGTVERIIVRTRPGTEGRVERELSRQSRHAARFGLSLVSGVTTIATRSELKALAEHPDVEGISIDGVVSAHQSASDPCWTWSGDPANGPCTQATSQYYALRGALGYRSSNWPGRNVGVAVIDSGISLAGDAYVSHFFDFTSGVPQSRSAIDGYGHGTHVAGLIASAGTRSGGHYQGIAPGVRLIGLRVLDSAGQGLTSHVIRAIEFATANRAVLGIDVINLSLGHPIYEPAASDPLVLAVESAVRAGIVVVASAGNMGASPVTGEVGYGGISSPGNAPSAITVGAVDLKGTANRADDTVPAYSSRGPSWFDGFAKPDIVAPGHRLVAPTPAFSMLSLLYPLLRVQPQSTFASTHMRLSGTSMSTAVVSGIVAAMIEVQRYQFGTSASPNAIKAMLQYSAIKLPGVDALSQGAGSVNMAGALLLARRSNPHVGYGQWWLTSNVSPSTTIDGSALAWSTEIIWNNHVVWGDTVQYKQAAWANHVVWGDTSAGWNSPVSQGSHVVWGDTAVWVNHVVWGDSTLGTSKGNHVVWGDTNVNANNVAWKPIKEQNQSKGLLARLFAP